MGSHPKTTLFTFTAIIEIKFGLLGYETGE
jgi:hypothetical protein